MLDHAEHIEIIGEAGTVAAGIEKAHRLRPDVVLIELRLPDGKGIDVLRRIHDVSPDIRLLVLTHSPDDRSIISALRSGAAGFLLKIVTGPELIHAVETVAAGQSILHPDVSAIVMTYIRNQAASICHKIGEGLVAHEQQIMKLTLQKQPIRKSLTPSRSLIRRSRIT